MNDATRECKYCRNVIPADSAKCGNCGEWREDIRHERNRCYLWSFIAALPTMAFFYGKAQGWWRPSLKPEGDKAIGVDLAQRVVESVVKAFAPVTFDWITFFSSPSGLAVIAAFGLAFALSLKYYISVSRKMENWIWL